MSGHTPGPWLIEKYCDGTMQICGDLLVVDDDNEVYSVIAEAITPCAQAEGNANLIAAAPDLLEALIECLPCLGWQHDDLEELQREHELGNDYAQLIIRARAAIAKAKGEQQ